MKLNEQVPSEAQEQTNLFEWCDWQNDPLLDMLYAVPNGGSRYMAEAVNLKRQGVKAGVPDMFLPVARHGYHGLYIELKRIKCGRLSLAQKFWLERLREQGYAACVCFGADDARKVIKAYLDEDYPAADIEALLMQHDGI